MSDLAVNKKKQARKRSFILIGILVLFVLQVGAEQKSRFLFGVYTGWSFGLGYEFRWHYRSHYSDDYNLIFHLGGYAQYNISERFGLQFNVNYQGIANRWTFSYYWDPPTSGTDGMGFFSLNLNGVFNYLKLKNTQFYFLGGGGICSGKWEAFHGLYFNFVAGTGVKIYLKPDSQRAINLGGTFQHLLAPHSYGSYHANYLRFNLGLEIYPNDHKN